MVSPVSKTPLVTTIPPTSSKTSANTPSASGRSASSGAGSDPFPLNMFAKFVKKFADAAGSSVRSFLDLYKESYSLRRSGSDKTKYASAIT